LSEPISLAEARSQNLISPFFSVSAQLPEASTRPSGVRTMLVTFQVCPVRLAISRHSAVSQILIILSWHAETRAGTVGKLSRESHPFRQPSECGPFGRHVAFPVCRTPVCRAAHVPERISEGDRGQRHRGAACCRTFLCRRPPGARRSRAASVSPARGHWSSYRRCRWDQFTRPPPAPPCEGGERPIQCDVPARWRAHQRTKAETNSPMSMMSDPWCKP